MADRSEISKVVAYSGTGQTNAVKVTKVAAYFVLEPGGDEPDVSNRQGHVYVQIVGN